MPGLDRKGLPVAKKKGYDVTCYSLGVRRETSTDIRNRWLGEVTRRFPKGCDGRVVFSFGVNDTTLENGQPRVHPSDSILNTRKILTEANKRFPALMIGPAPVAEATQNQRILGLSSEFEKVSRELDVPYLDVFAPLHSSGIWMREVTQNDGSHPGFDGYVELAQLVQNWPAWISFLQEKE